ncbi:hypothetical protein RJT34_20444 [Clitoria ternatea]|uniref:Uncharacterized protein n=1 Tax=Clitoria ternatea TaxID=43366 RepID=A0AAN9P5S6_CLITE
MAKGVSISFWHGLQEWPLGFAKFLVNEKEMKWRQRACCDDCGDGSDVRSLTAWVLWWCKPLCGGTTGRDVVDVGSIAGLLQKLRADVWHEGHNRVLNMQRKLQCIGILCGQHWLLIFSWET